MFSVLNSVISVRKFQIHWHLNQVGFQLKVACIFYTAMNLQSLVCLGSSNMNPGEELLKQKSVLTKYCAARKA